MCVFRFWFGFFEIVSCIVVETEMDEEFVFCFVAVGGGVLVRVSLTVSESESVADCEIIIPFSQRNVAELAVLAKFFLKYLSVSEVKSLQWKMKLLF